MRIKYIIIFFDKAESMTEEILSDISGNSSSWKVLLDDICYSNFDVLSDKYINNFFSNIRKYHDKILNFRGVDTREELMAVKEEYKKLRKIDNSQKIKII